MKFMTLIMMMAASAAFAAGGEGHHAEGVPTVVFWQAANLLIIFGAGWYFFGKKVLGTFKERNSLFLNESAKSKSIQQEAEKKLMDIKHKLNHLEETAEESVLRARAEAADIRNQLIEEAKQFAAKIKREAETAAQIEIQSAKRALHEEVVKESVKQAREILKKDVGQSDQQRLQDQFSNQIEGVRL